MAVTLINTAALQGDGDTTAQSVDYAPTSSDANTMLLVLLSGRAQTGDPAATPTWNGTPMTHIISNAEGYMCVGAWYVLNPGTTSRAIAVTHPWASKVHFVVRLLGNVDTGSLIAGATRQGGSVASAATPTYPDASVSTNTGGMVLDVLALSADRDASIAAGAGQTNLITAIHETGGDELHTYASTHDGGTGINLSWSWTTDCRAHMCQVAINAGAAVSLFPQVIMVL